MRILVVKLGALGDVINTLPLAAVLKQMPGCTIDWLVEPLSMPLVSSHRAVDRVIVFHHTAASAFSVIRTIRKTRYDLVLDLQRILKSGLFTLLARTSRRIGFDRKRCKEMTWFLPFDRIRPKNPRAHMLDQYLEFAKHLGLKPGFPVWDIPRTGSLPVPLPNTYVVLNIGATKPANLWDPERFAELAQKIWEGLGFPCVITGGPADTSRAARILACYASHVSNLTGQTTLPELVEVIGHARAVISCDTGPMHLASALNIPLVALFGPSDPRRTGPYRGRVIRGTAPCVPCNRKRCSTTECMRSITPDMVVSELAKEIAVENVIRTVQVGKKLPGKGTWRPGKKPA